MTAVKLKALAMKQAVMPRLEMSAAEASGPTILAMLMVIELIDTALAMASRGTNW
ncbi:hypothetical protein D3C87_1816370 [compost metagenome]